MNTVTDEKTVGVPLKRYLLAGLYAGLIAAVVNNIYHTVYTALTGVAAPSVINYVTVTLASVIPLVLASLVYYVLAQNAKQPTAVFIFMTVFLTIASSGLMAVPHLPNRAPLPQGFMGLALPMHYIAGLIALFFIPRYVGAGRKLRS